MVAWYSLSGLGEAWCEQYKLKWDSPVPLNQFKIPFLQISEILLCYSVSECFLQSYQNFFFPLYLGKNSFRFLFKISIHGFLLTKFLYSHSLLLWGALSDATFSFSLHLESRLSALLGERIHKICCHLNKTVLLVLNSLPPHKIQMHKRCQIFTHHIKMKTCSPRLRGPDLHQWCRYSWQWSSNLGSI